MLNSNPNPPYAIFDSNTIKEGDYISHPPSFSLYSPIKTVNPMNSSSSPNNAKFEGRKQWSPSPRTFWNRNHNMEMNFVGNRKRMAGVNFENRARNCHSESALGIGMMGHASGYPYHHGNYFPNNSDNQRAYVVTHTQRAYENYQQIPPLSSQSGMFGGAVNVTSVSHFPFPPSPFGYSFPPPPLPTTTSGFNDVPTKLQQQFPNIKFSEPRIWSSKNSGGRPRHESKPDTEARISIGDDNGGIEEQQQQQQQIGAECETTMEYVQSELIIVEGEGSTEEQTANEEEEKGNLAQNG